MTYEAEVGKVMWALILVVAACAVWVGWKKRRGSPSSTSKLKPEPKKYNVGRIISRVVEKSGRAWTLQHVGYLYTFDWMGDDSHVEHDANDVFEEWRKKGSSGLLWVARGQYIALCNVDLIDNVLEDLFVTYDEPISKNVKGREMWGTYEYKEPKPAVVAPAAPASIEEPDGRGGEADGR